MITRVVLAFPATGTSASLAAHRNAEVVAVIVDVGQTADLEEVRARALAGGAVRAHVVDRREAFAREAVVSLATDSPVNNEQIAGLAQNVVADAVSEVAEIESARVVEIGDVASSHLFNRPSAACAPSDEATMTLDFEAGLPVSINGVAMDLPDLIESVSLIAGQFGVGATVVPQMPAAVVLQAALHAAGGDGTASVRLTSGSMNVVAIEAPQLVTRS